VDHFETGGYPVLRADQRGPVDTDANADSWVEQSRLNWKIDDDTKFQLTGSAFDEHRNNGTRLTHNASAGQDFSATLDRSIPELNANLRLQAYVQDRTFSSTFSSVNADRTIETLALDQFDVPATAAGGSAVWSQQISDAHRLIGGADFRWIEGETNEHFLRVGDVLTRSRTAGGQQLFAGAFVEENWRVSDAVKVVAGGRVDYWRQYDGIRVERDRATGAVLRDQEFADQDGLAPNGRLGINVQLKPTVRARAAAYTGFRAPTLNELYRPFRVGNDITEANAALEPERLYGAELGVDWKPVERVSFSATVFYNELHNAIGNVTIGEGPGTFDPGGFVPAGGVLRQRRNLDLVEVFGVEAKFLWEFAPDWRLRVQFLYTHPIVADAAESPQLEGKRLAQAPEYVAVTALDWTPGRWRASAQVRCVGGQYEDDLNTLPLAGFATVDLALGYEFNDHLTGALKIENVFDRETEVGKSASGLVSIGAPRLVSLTIAVNF
jgi:outer membrane receptor protein involved in Fe transport